MVQVEITGLVRNSKVARWKPFVAKVDLQKRDIEFLRALVPEYRRGLLAGGTYDVEPWSYIIVRSDWSSHRHGRYSLTLYRVKPKGGNEGELEKIAEIDYVSGHYEFEPPELKNLYAEAKKQIQEGTIKAKSAAIAALIEYAIKHAKTTTKETRERPQPLIQLEEQGDWVKINKIIAPQSIVDTIVKIIEQAMIEGKARIDEKDNLYIKKEVLQELLAKKAALPA